MPVPTAVLGVMAAGALGAWARYLVGLGLQRRSVDFPWGTLCINTSGCVLIAIIGAEATRLPGLAPFLRQDAATGFIGAYTTFSTFAVETLQIARTRPLSAALYVVGSTAAGLGAIVLGRWLGA